MDAKHTPTPGPWVDQDGTIWTCLHDPVETTYDIGTPIADVRRLRSFAGPAYPAGEPEANARLIAAAPAMLEALCPLAAIYDDLLERYDGDPKGYCSRIDVPVPLLKAAWAALAKATGQPAKETTDG